jgi:hypothetical protein
MKSAFLLAITIICLYSTAQTGSVTALFIYGSKPNSDTEGKWFGGKWGGHVGLEVGKDSVFHFNPSGKVGAFGDKNHPGSWVLSSKAQFLCTFGCDSNKVCEIEIPIDSISQQQIRQQALSFLHHSPYPYAFFGMRCTSSCYHLLSFGGIVPTTRKSAMIRTNFYPRKLRKYLLKQAQQNNWKITRTIGKSSRTWDHD